MMIGRFSLTARLLKDILVEAIEVTVREIGSVFEIVDEEPITFTFILKAKMLISENKAHIKESVIKDIIRIIRTNPLRRVDHGEIKLYVERNLIIDVVGHNRHFESTKSGSDFGLLFSLPEVANSYGREAVRPNYMGILIQAKITFCH